MAMTRSAAPARGGGSSSSSSNDNNDNKKDMTAAMLDDHRGGDLLPYIEQLRQHMPVDGGVMPMAELLQTLRTAAPEVFAQLDRFVAVARDVAGVSEAMALQWKAKGSAQYAAGQLPEALLSYTHGLLCAESDDTVATLLNNRSTVLYAMGNYAAACLDADRALRYCATYWKALLRRGRALQQLGLDKALGQRDVDAAEAQCLAQANPRDVMRRVLGIDEDDDNADGNDDGGATTRKATTTTTAAAAVLPPRVSLPGALLRVERAVAPKDRRVCARARIASGTTVLRETPMAHTARTDAMLSVCAYCLQPATCLYHGDDYRRAKRKSRGLFCSPACAAASWRCYGAHEQHSVFFLCCPNDALLATRLLRNTRAYPRLTTLDVAAKEEDSSTQTTAASTGDSNSNNSSKCDGDVAAEGGNVLTCDMFDTAFWRTLRGSHSRELQLRSAGGNSHDASGAANVPQVDAGGCESIVAALALYMNAVDTPAEAEQLRKAQRQILLHGVTMTYTARVAAQQTTAAAAAAASAAQQQVFDETEAYTHVPVRAGRAMYAAASLLNHACEPNCFVSFVGNPHSCSAELVVRTVRDVCAGEELTVAYDALTCYQLHSTRHRRSVLYARYGFVCHCDACDDAAAANSSGRRRIADEPVNEATKAHYVQAADLYQKGKRMMREGKHRAALTALSQSYELTMRHVCPPPQPPQAMLPRLHNALALAHYHLHDVRNCVAHLKAELQVDAELHGSDNRADLVRAYTRLATLLHNDDANDNSNEKDRSEKAAERALYARKAEALLRRFYAPSPVLEMQCAHLRSLARDTTHNTTAIVVGDDNNTAANATASSSSTAAAVVGDATSTHTAS